MNYCLIGSGRDVFNTVYLKTKNPPSASLGLASQGLIVSLIMGHNLITAEVNARVR